MWSLKNLAVITSTIKFLIIMKTKRETTWSGPLTGPATGKGNAYVGGGTAGGGTSGYYTKPKYYTKEKKQDGTAHIFGLFPAPLYNTCGDSSLDSTEVIKENKRIL
jgi:hypothetical protein